MVDVNASITKSVTKSVSVTQSVTRAVSIDEVIASPYDPVTATNPDFFLPLKYANTDADGQILYQDSGATTPVTTAGDPVGAVKWDGSVIATQSTDANRPIWQGESVGVRFNEGSNQYLVASSNWLPASANWTLFIHYTAQTDPATTRAPLSQYTSSTTNGRIQLLNTEDARDALELFSGDADGATNIFLTPIISNPGLSTYVWGGRRTSDTFEGLAGDTLVQTQTLSSAVIDTAALHIGCRGPNSSSPDLFANMDSKAVAVWTSSLSGADLTAAADALEAL